jgi:hypothetical protein
MEMHSSSSQSLTPMPLNVARAGRRSGAANTGPYRSSKAKVCSGEQEEKAPRWAEGRRLKGG